jgi:hypothetical protein
MTGVNADACETAGVDAPRYSAPAAFAPRYHFG